MPRGRPPRVIEDTSDLTKYQKAEEAIAGVLHGTCPIQGCQPKWHMDEARAILRKLIRLNIIKEDD